jgi:hypothetical protein
MAHSLTVLSPAPEANQAPFGENAIEFTPFAWPASVPIGLPFVLSQSFTVRSALPVAIRVPSGE